MLQLENHTPFEAHLTVLPDTDGADTLLATVKATFAMSQGTPLAAEQVSVVVSDEYRGEPGASSLARAGEVHLPKPGTDVLLVGSARAPGDRPVRELEVSVRVGVLEKSLRVLGDRPWSKRLTSLVPGRPEPFTTMPLVYERAYGGLHALDMDKGRFYGEPRNPVGCGFVGKRSLPEQRELPVPNLEDLKRPLKKSGGKSVPACFAPIAPWWAPRTDYVGTYDDEWIARRAPFLPTDFDARFFHLAAPELTSSEPLTGGEPVELSGVSTRGVLAFALPTIALAVEVDVAGALEKPTVSLETVLFEPDDERFCLVWRAAVRCDKKALQARALRIEAEGVPA